MLLTFRLGRNEVFMVPQHHLGHTLDEVSSSCLYVSIQLMQENFTFMRRTEDLRMQKSQVLPPKRHLIIGDPCNFDFCYLPSHKHSLEDRSSRGKQSIYNPLPFKHPDSMSPFMV